MLFISQGKSWIPFVKIFSMIFAYSIIFFFPQGFLWGAIILASASVFLFINFHPIKIWKKTLGFFFQTFCLDILVLISLLFISSTLVAFLLVGLHLCLTFLFWRTHFFFWHKKEKYEQFSYENIVNVITLFLFYLSGLNGSALIIFLGIHPWIIFLSFAILILMISIIYFQAHHVSFPKNFFLGVLLTLIAQELFWALGILPLSFPVIGLIFATLLYFTMSIFRFYALCQINGVIWRRYALLTFIILILTLFTARWN